MRKTILFLMVFLLVTISLVMCSCEGKENLDDTNKKAVTSSEEVKLPDEEVNKASIPEEEQADPKEVEKVVLEWFDLLNKGDEESQLEAAKLCFLFEELREKNLMTKADLILWTLGLRSQGYTEKIEEGIKNHQLEDIEVLKISFHGEGKVPDFWYGKVGGPKTYDRAVTVDVRIDLKDGGWFEETVRLVHYKGEWKIDF